MAFLDTGKVTKARDREIMIHSKIDINICCIESSNGWGTVTYTSTIHTDSSFIQDGEMVHSTTVTKIPERSATYGLYSKTVEEASKYMREGFGLLMALEDLAEHLRKRQTK